MAPFHLFLTLTAPELLAGCRQVGLVADPTDRLHRSVEVVAPLAQEHRALGEATGEALSKGFSGLGIGKCFAKEGSPSTLLPSCILKVKESGLGKN